MISKSTGKEWSGDEHLPPEARRHAKKMLETVEPDEDTKSVSFGRIGGRSSQRGVRFISGHGIDGHKGKVFSRDYSHYLGCDEDENGNLVVTFTDRRVILEGRCLCWPAETSLVRYFTDHKVAVIEAIPEARDGFTAGGKPPKSEPVVYRIRVEAAE